MGALGDDRLFRRIATDTSRMTTGTGHGDVAPAARGDQASRRVRNEAARGRKRFSRVVFYGHLWLGVIFTIALVMIAVTGILLNHKRGLGLMPEVDNLPARPFAESMTLSQLADIALRAVAPAGHAAGTPDDIDRMDVRPGDGLVKVRMKDAASTEVTVDLGTGRVLHVGRRGDVFLEKLHSGETFGKRWVLLSDAAAVALALTLLTGYWLWLAPKLRRAGEAFAGEEAVR
jgi:hypothetical protein